MKKEKHEEVMKEVLDEVDAASKDQKGLVSHQRRLAFSLSLGAVNILEIYFHNMEVIKAGSKINHLWFKRRKAHILEKLQNQVISPIDTLEDINRAIDLIIKIEEKRDDLAYGVPSTEEVLQEKINLFFELKKLLKC